MACLRLNASKRFYYQYSVFDYQMLGLFTIWHECSCPILQAISDEMINLENFDLILSHWFDLHFFHQFCSKIKMNFSIQIKINYIIPSIFQQRHLPYFLAAWINSAQISKKFSYIFVERRLHWYYYAYTLINGQNCCQYYFFYQKAGCQRFLDEDQILLH